MESSTSSVLAGEHGADLPGLPRGRTKLPQTEVRAAQVRRILRAVVLEVSKKSYAEVTVTDIVKSARVGRNVFYEHFTDKRDCFLAAARDGATLLYDRMHSAILDAEPGREARAAVRAYLDVVISEPEFIRCFFVEILATGDVGLQFRIQVAQNFVPMVRAALTGGHSERAVESEPDMPPTDYALTAGIGELVIAYYAMGKVAEIRDLEDDIVDLTYRILDLPKPEDA